MNLHQQLLNANGTVQSILRQYSEIKFSIIKQEANTLEHGYRFERDIEITGQDILVRAHSVILTEFKQLEHISIGDFLSKRDVIFSLSKSLWVCEKCARAINFNCKHITDSPRLLREYTLKTQGFKCLISESFIKIPQ